MIFPNKLREIDSLPGVSSQDFRIALGSAAEKYSEEEIEEMRIRFDKIADLVFDEWLAKRNTPLEAL